MRAHVQNSPNAVLVAVRRIAINGRSWPHTERFTYAVGDTVRWRWINGSYLPHPMHLHGPHAVVLSRDGKQATGSPWWFDSLEVRDKETFKVAFVADNPGVWMDHCHNLPHAAEGLVAHLAYNGVREPFVVGRAVGDSHNQPE